MKMRKSNNFYNFLIYFMSIKTRNNNFLEFFVVRAQKSETAINQTPISSIGKKDPLHETRNVCVWVMGKQCYEYQESKRLFSV